jgi:F-type H+-transporting ATPase subunit b
MPAGHPKVGAPPGAPAPGAPVGPHGAAAPAGAHGSGHAGSSAGHGPTDKPPVVNLVQGWLGVSNERAAPPPAGARVGSLDWWLWHLTPYPFRYQNPKDKYDPRNQPVPLIAPVFNFGVLCFLLWRFGRKPVRDALRQRAAAIQAQIENARLEKRRARARLREHRHELDHLGDTLDELRARYSAEAEAERQALERQAELARDRLLEDATFRVAQEARAARDVLSRQAMEQAVGAAEAMLARCITPQDHDRLGEEYLRTVRAALVAERLGSNAGATP